MLRHDLDGDDFTACAVTAAVNGAHAPLGNLFHKIVIANSVHASAHCVHRHRRCPQFREGWPKVRFGPLRYHSIMCLVFTLVNNGMRSCASFLEVWKVRVFLLSAYRNSGSVTT